MIPSASFLQRVVRPSFYALWVLALGGIAVAQIVEALLPVTLIWDTIAPVGPGQLTFFDRALDGGRVGMPVEIGDYDGDGKVDLVMAPMISPSGPEGDRTDAGEVYVLRGDGDLSTRTIDRSEFSDETFPGLTIYGARAFDMFGTELFTADFDGDGIQDLIVGAQNYDGPFGNRLTCGGAFVIFGRSDLLDTGSVLDLAFDPASPPEGVVTIFGERSGDRLGVWVEAGDLDGDGRDDLLLGADQSSNASAGSTPECEPREPGLAGMTTIVYGRPREEFPSIIDLADSDGVTDLSLIYGRDEGDHFGSTLHARDLDGDGRDELIASAAINRLSAQQLDSPPVSPAVGDGGGDGPENLRCDAGEVYVFFSDPSGSRLPRRIDLASDLDDEMRSRLAIIYGASAREEAGEELTSGDLDGDGKNELILGALSARNPRDHFLAGAVYVFYGADQLRGHEFDLAALREEDPAPPLGGNLIEGIRVSRMWGNGPLHIFGDTLSVADFNRDGFDDLAIGIPKVEVETRDDTGIVAVVFGNPEPFPDNYFPRDGMLENGPLIAFVRGADTGDNFSYSMEARDYDDDGYDDLFPNAMRGDGPTNELEDAGEAFVISGFHFSGQQVTIESVIPSRGIVGEATEVKLIGTGFTRDHDTRVTIGDVEATDIGVLSGTELTATFPAAASAGVVTVTIENRHGSAELIDGFQSSEPESFIRGDSDRDQAVETDDVIVTLEYLFLGGSAECLDAHDSNDSGLVDISDPVKTLTHLFLGAGALPAPFPNAGADPTPDGLTCP